MDSFGTCEESCKFMDFHLYFNMFYSSIFTEKDHLHDFSCYTKVIIGSKKNQTSNDSEKPATKTLFYNYRGFFYSLLRHPEDQMCN